MMLPADAEGRLRALRRQLEKLKGRSVSELRERAAQAVSAQWERRRLASTVGEPTDRAFLAMLDPAVMAPGPELAERLHAHFVKRTVPAFFAGVRDGSSAQELGTVRWTAQRERLIAAADGILAGQFDLLGYRGLSFGDPIDWHFDPVAQKRAPRVHWSRIRYLDAEAMGDHKVIWELNRHQHLMVLGRAFQVTRHERYARCFAAHVNSWMNENPPKTGVNWASSLEISYRAIAWLWAIELFRDARALTPALLRRMLTYLYLHGRHLERYLSTYFSPNTHLTGEALGLLYLGVLLPEFHRASLWKRLGWQILESELPRQVHADGVYFEQATYYHRYTVDIYLHSVLLARSSGITVTRKLLDRLDLAAGHLADLTRPDGTVPLIGDDDGGRLIALEDRAHADVRSALATAAVVLGRPAYAVVAGGATEEALWLLGIEGLRVLDEWRGGPPPAHTSTLYPEGGYAIMRDGWGAEAKHAVIDCGPHGALSCGHSHSDALSIDISVGGCSMLVDAGTYAYTVSPSDRDAFRHSAAHNSVTVDGYSASVSAGPFSWEHRADARVEQWWTGARVDRCVGSHQGFARLSAPALHRRCVLFVRGEYWVVADTVLASGHHQVIAHYHAAAGSVIIRQSERSARIVAPCANGRCGLFFAVAGNGIALEWEEDWVSSAYGMRERGPRASAISSGTGRRDIVVALVPGVEGERISFQELAIDRGRAVVVDRPGSYDVFLFEEGGQARATGTEMDGDAAWVRRFSKEGALEVVALFGERARLSIDGLTFVAHGAAEWVRNGAGWQMEGDGTVTARE